YNTALGGSNLVENKPPSETNGLSFNYINWLATVNDTDSIIRQTLGVPIPTALLYLMLRNALLLQLHHGAYEWLSGRTDFAAPLLQSTRPTTLPGMRETAPALSKIEMMGVRVGPALPTHPMARASVADFIWTVPDTGEAEAAFLREQKAALLILAEATTARLERCLVEHIHCCNYRLDAWQTGLFAQRLHAHRDFDPMTDGRQQGIYLGAFG